MALNEVNIGERRIDRLDKFIRYSQINDNRVTKECGLSVGTLGKSRKPGKDISVKTATAVIERYPQLNKVWLLTGAGDMLSTSKEPSYPSYPLLDTSKAECGKAFSVAVSVMAEDMPYISIPGVPTDTEFFVQASGHSMLNKDKPELSIPTGSLVGLCRIRGNVLNWGEVYALSTNDGIMIKRLLPGEDNSIRCISYNSGDYPEFTIKRDDINDIARITCVVPVFIR